MTETTEPAVAQRATVATRIIRDAGALASDYFRRYRSLAVETKSNPQDIVSEADRRVEQLIRDALTAQFPEDGFIGEEQGRHEGASGFTWLIDPIDGTSPFLHGLRSWCVVIALLRNEEAVLGLIFDPSADELFSAIRGGGARLDGQPIGVDTRSTINLGLTCISATIDVPAADVAAIIGRLHEAGGAFIRLGSAALTLAQVAAGRLVGYYEPRLHAWDCVAGLLIVEEAGGAVRPFPMSQHGIETGPVFAASPQVCQQLLAIVTGEPG